MDPFTHTFAGGLMASGGLRKLTPLATAALLIGANAPDIDIVTSWMGNTPRWLIVVAGPMGCWPGWYCRSRLPQC